MALSAPSIVIGFLSDLLGSDLFGLGYDCFKKLLTIAGNVNSPCLGSQGNRNSPLWMAVG